MKTTENQQMPRWWRNNLSCRALWVCVIQKQKLNFHFQWFVLVPLAGVCVYIDNTNLSNDKKIIIPWKKAPILTAVGGAYKNWYYNLRLVTACSESTARNNGKLGDSRVYWYYNSWLVTCLHVNGLIDCQTIKLHLPTENIGFSILVTFNVVYKRGNHLVSL